MPVEHPLASAQPHSMPCPTGLKPSPGSKDLTLEGSKERAALSEEITRGRHSHSLIITSPNSSVY